jgi:hypothetical protein
MPVSGIHDAETKLRWAKTHLHFLNREVETFSNSNPYTLTREDDLENQRHVLRFNLLNVPDPICLIAGDAIYNMRASLDHLVWSLARLSGIPKRTAFPIVDGPVLTKSRLESFNRSLDGVSQEAICEIAALQPYHRGAAYKSHPLWRLDEICNLDKHRRIPANGSASILHFPNLAPGEEKSILTVEVTDTGYIMSVPIGQKQKLDLHDTMRFAVHFGGDESGINEDFSGLVEIYNFVAESVMPRFVRFFT